VLRTAEAVSPISQGEVSVSLVCFMAIYALIFSAGVLYILRLINEGPIPTAGTPPPLAVRPPGYALAAAPNEPAAPPQGAPRGPGGEAP
jgi:cytochrome d ubiquinol oxidase subunit I